MTKVAFISLIESNNFKEACVNDFWIIVMQEKLTNLLEMMYEILYNDYMIIRLLVSSGYLRTTITNPDK